MATFIGLVILVVVIWVLATKKPLRAEDLRASLKESPSTTAAVQAKPQSAQMVCPHCQTKGSVTTRRVKLKKGISGGKAVGALMTAGVSVLAVGLSRKEKATEAKCSNCGSVWHF